MQHVAFDPNGTESQMASMKQGVSQQKQTTTSYCKKSVKCEPVMERRKEKSINLIWHISYRDAN